MLKIIIYIDSNLKQCRNVTKIVYSKAISTSVLKKPMFKVIYNISFGQNQNCKDTFYIGFRLTNVIFCKKFNNNNNNLQ